MRGCGWDAHRVFDIAVPLFPVGRSWHTVVRHQPDGMVDGNETMKLVEDDASMNAIIAKVMELQNQESTDLPIYEKQLKETEVGITNMLNAIQMGILTSSTKGRLEALEEQRKELQARIAEERLAKPKMKEEFVRFWLLRFRKLDMTQPEQRQALVDTLSS